MQAFTLFIVYIIVNTFLQIMHQETPVKKAIHGCQCTLLFGQSNLFSGAAPENFASYRIKSLFWLFLILK